MKMNNKMSNVSPMYWSHIVDNFIQIEIIIYKRNRELKWKFVRNVKKLLILDVMNEELIE